MKIIHISDTHIRNLKYHKEYRTVFEQMYSLIKKEEPDLIVHCGDIGHTKTQISPEFVEMTSDFLRNLSNIAQLYIILGNHDGNLKNSDRQDAISPIVDAIGSNRIHLLKKSGEVQVNDSLTLNVLSIFDEENWQPISDKNKINIALYHGSVSGVETDTGYVLEHGDHPIEIFKDFDFGLLGDIHRTNQVLDQEGRLRYCGSTIQQNFSETNDKGFLIWEIEDKNNFNVRHVSISNPRPFVTIEVDKDGQFSESLQIPADAKVRLVSDTHVSSQTLKKTVDIVKKRFNPQSITVHNRPGKRLSVEELSGTFEEDNLRDIKIQESLMKDYLKDYKLNNNVFDKILDLNKKYNILVEQTEEVARNISWKVKNIEWDNLFNYGENNSIDFEKLNGIIGVFGKNYTGKSSSIDTILWTMFNSVSKKIRKNVDIINQNKDKCFSKVEIEVDNKVYTIERGSSKYTKKLYGEETIEAKTSLEFSVFDSITNEKEILNGEDRNATDANIRKIFGTVDDFLLTSVSSQMGSMNFIEEGSTRRKEILGKFLDLEMFDKKFKLAKDDSALLKGAIKRLEGKDYDGEIEEASKKILLVKKNILENKQFTVSLKRQKQELVDLISEVEFKIKSGPKQEVIKIEDIKEKIASIDVSLEQCRVIEQKYSEQITNCEKEVQEFQNLLDTYDLDTLKKNKKLYEDFKNNLSLLLNKKTLTEKELNSKKEKISILNTVPCEDKYPTCRFLLDANKQKSELPIFEDTYRKILKDIEEISENIKGLDRVQEEVDLYESVNTKLLKHKTFVSDLYLKSERNKAMSKSFEANKLELHLKEKTYYENEEWIKELIVLETDKENLEKSLILINNKLEESDSRSLALHKDSGYSEQYRETLKEQKQELSNLRDEYLAYELFMKCMHSNGIVYDIIKNKLPIINQEISRNLSGIVDFDIFFEDDGKKLDIFIKHPKYEPRPIELCSGAEKTMASMAIRLALIKVSSLPKSDLFVLDEPAVSLDENNMEGFTRILEMIKSQFKTVLLISHLDALKDTVDDQIVINKTNGYAKINI